MAINLAKAWRDLADPITPIKAEKNDVANSPSKIKSPEIFVYQSVSWVLAIWKRKLTSCIMFKSLYMESREIEAPIDKITKVYVMNVKRSPCSVPLGIDLLGFRRSPDILAPLYSIKHHVRTSRHTRRMRNLRKNSTTCWKKDAKEILEIHSP